MRRADELAGCTEGSADLRRITDAIEAYERCAGQATGSPAARVKSNESRPK